MVARHINTPPGAGARRIAGSAPVGAKSAPTSAPPAMRTPTTPVLPEFTERTLHSP